MNYNILFFIVAAHITLGRADCEINPLVYTNSPLVIPTGSNSFLYPDYGDSTLKINAGDTVDLVCPGRRLIVLGQVTEEVIQATCISNIRFRILGERTLFTQVSCNGDAVTSSRYTGRTCESGGRDAEVGFSLSDGRFLRVLQICYDTTGQAPLYSYYNLTKSIGNNAKGTPRPEFSQDVGFYSIGSRTVNQLYTRTPQRQTINGLLGLAATSTQYVQDGSWFFLARGHLTARADFYYPAQQNATFRYINAAPQWQTFNGLNWNYIEQSTRDYADRTGADLQVWTGLHGITTLPHATTGAAIPLYIYVDGTARALAVPQLYWKVIYNPSTRRGIALIGLNNPYQTNVASGVICPDISSSVTWVTWNRLNITQGYSYACTIASLRSVVSYVPNLTVSGLLT